MNAQHTPGPWNFSPGSDSHQQAQVWREDGKTIAITYDDEGSANARLIAAAPELLAALHQACNLTLDEESDTAHAAFLRVARAAIRKATQP
jgi:hypothetical protein